MDIPECEDLKMQEILLNESRISSVGNGSNSQGSDTILYTSKPTVGQKWWASIILGFIFALMSSPLAYSITAKIKLSRTPSPKTDIYSLTIHTIIFILIIRIILW